MSELSVKTAVELVAIIVESAALAQSHAVKCAKCIVALIKVTGSEAKAKAAMKGKVSECTLRNSMQLVWTYDAVVTPGHATEEWFDGLLYTHAVAIRHALVKVSAKQLAEWGLFKQSSKANTIEFDLIGDTGLNKAQRIAAADKKAEKEIADAKKKLDNPVLPADAVVETTSGKTEETPAAATSGKSEEKATERKGGKDKGPVLEQFETLCKSVEVFIDATFTSSNELAIETMRARLAELSAKANAIAKGMKPARKVG